MLGPQRFDDHFEVILADTPESQTAHYRLRYRVYCDEMGYEDKARFADYRERDEWDDYSTHFLVRDRESKTYWGALRLINPDRQRLPFLDKTRPYHKLQSSQFKNSAEISRLCVVKEARRLMPGYLVDHSSGSNIRDLSLYRSLTRRLMWGLYRGALDYSKDNGIKDWYIFVAPSLAHVIKKEGFEMRQIGAPCEFHGLRTPYALSVDEILTNPFWRDDFRLGYTLHSRSDCLPQRVKGVAS